MRTLLAGALTCLLGLAAAGLGLRTYASRHFLPRQHLQEALAAGDGCVLVLGDSRTEAAFDAVAFHHGLRARGADRDRCLAVLPVGATDIAGHFLTAREYLAQGRRPSVAVLGIAGDSILGPETPLDPRDLVGNNVIHFEWAHPADVFDEVPGFPGRDVGAFDAGFRYLADLATPFGRYQSLVAVKTQALTRRLTGRAEAERNRFGAFADMVALESGLRSRAPERLAAAMRGSEGERLGLWFPRLAALLEAHGARLLVVELPMRRVYRDNVTDLPSSSAFRAWLAGELARRHESWLDLSHEPSIDDGLFSDALHLAPAGAAIVSDEIGLFLGDRVAPPVAQPPNAP
jgi:hypothetical protein